MITWELAVKTFIYPEFSWLSFDNVVKRVVDPKGELCIFILQKTTVPNVLIFFFPCMRSGCLVVAIYQIFKSIGKLF